MKNENEKYHFYLLPVQEGSHTPPGQVLADNWREPEWRREADSSQQVCSPRKTEPLGRGRGKMALAAGREFI